MTRNRSRGAPPPPPTPVNPYWYLFPGFEPKPLASVSKEFNRLAHHMGWDFHERRERKYEAYESEFNFFFLGHGSNLETWQNLCEEVGIDEVPPSITKCKAALKTVYINLDNLLHVRRNPSVKLIKFRTYGQFLKYTRNGRYVPKDGAKSEGFVSIFLRDVDHSRY